MHHFSPLAVCVILSPILGPPGPPHRHQRPEWGHGESRVRRGRGRVARGCGVARGFRCWVFHVCLCASVQPLCRACPRSRCRSARSGLGRRARRGRPRDLPRKLPRAARRGRVEREARAERPEEAEGGVAVGRGVAGGFGRVQWTVRVTLNAALIYYCVLCKKTRGETTRCQRQAPIFAGGALCGRGRHLDARPQRRERGGGTPPRRRRWAALSSRTSRRRPPGIPEARGVPRGRAA
mmetsp:Transcript_30843/g.91654  ORF Transcript_30843/g.91654 Transcript_30843/m.91654 type:complete len:237 (-) Transcript_30843:914-1624(-)